MYTALNRLLRSFAHFFYFNCELVLFVYIVRQKQTKISRNLQNISWIFKIFKNRIFSNANFWKFDPKTFLGVTQGPTTNFSVQPFWRLLDTNKQTGSICRFIHKWIEFFPKTFFRIPISLQPNIGTSDISNNEIVRWNNKFDISKVYSIRW